MANTTQKKAGKKNFYTDSAKLFVAVDCIIFGFHNNELMILLLTRHSEPEKGKSSLIGGFILEDENLDEASHRILYEHTGLKNVFLEQLMAFGDVARDPGDRVISIAYYALLKVKDLNSEHVEKYDARWCPVNECGTLAFDHAEMKSKALQRLRRRAKNQPLGFELLPKQFTIPQLQSLYEAIYNKKLDNRNFRKKLLAMDILEKLDVKDKSASKKGAYQYKFDRRKYKKFLEEGFLFDL